MSSSIEIVPSATIAKSLWAGPVERSALRRRELDPLGGERSRAAVGRVESHADELAVHLQILDPAVRSERGAKPGMIDARDEEVLVVVGKPQELVAHGAAHDVRVEVEPTDVAAQFGRHGVDSADGDG